MSSTSSLPSSARTTVPAAGRGFSGATGPGRAGPADVRHAASTASHSLDREASHSAQRGHGTPLRPSLSISQCSGGSLGAGGWHSSSSASNGEAEKTLAYLP